MKIAFLTVGDSTRRTGGYLYHAEVFARLRQRGHTIHEISVSGAARTEQEARATAFGAAFNPTNYDVIVVDALARAVCAPHFDTWREQRPVIGMVHELPSVANNDEQERADEAPLLRADLLIAVSRHGKSILEARGVASERIHIVSPGRDRVPSPVSRPPSPVPRPLSTVLCVAQWIPRKNIGMLIAAWTRKQHKGQLVLVGETHADPAYAAVVRAAIVEANDPSIVVRGAIDDAELALAYQNASVFALPSRYEGYGMVYAEALSYGLPVIACNVGPVPELVGAAGVFVPVDDVVALTHAIDALLADPEQREILGRAAQLRAATLPTWDDTANGFEHALRIVRSSKFRVQNDHNHFEL